MELTVGQIYNYQKTITDQDIILFAEATGDKNPLHLDEEYARTTLFKGRIAHGMLAAGIISAVLGMQFPGPGTTYLGQSLKFLKPVRPGDLLSVHLVVTGVTQKSDFTIVTIDTTCVIGSETVLVGQATVIPPR